jgi:transcriptional regulator with XRE-family HTH domain
MGITVNLLVGRSICRLRQCANVSQEDLAREAGVSRLTIAHVESGRSAASPDLLERIASCLGLGSEEFLGIVEQATNAGILYRTWRILRKRESWLPLDEAERELGF